MGQTRFCFLHSSLLGWLLLALDKRPRFIKIMLTHSFIRQHIHGCVPSACCTLKTSFTSLNAASAFASQESNGSLEVLFFGKSLCALIGFELANKSESRFLRWLLFRLIAISMTINTWTQMSAVSGIRTQTRCKIILFHDFCVRWISLLPGQWQLSVSQEVAVSLGRITREIGVSHSHSLL